MTQKNFPDACVQLSAEGLQPRVCGRRQVLKRCDSGGHRHRICAERATVRHRRSSPAGVKNRHHVPAPADGTYRKASANKFSKSCEIWVNSEQTLRTVVP